MDENGTRSTLQQLVPPPEIQKQLGKKVTIQNDNVKRFEKELKPYVSSEPAWEDRDGLASGYSFNAPQIWPLVKSVRLRLDSKILKSGVVIVDLPGSKDANRARGAMAENYRQTCNAFWIVAPINRAIDNKAARDLLGKSFRRQLLMEGGYSCVTFICTKTADISCTKMRNSPGMAEQLQSLEEEKRGIQLAMGKLRKEMEAKAIEVRDLERTICSYRSKADLDSDVEELDPYHSQFLFGSQNSPGEGSIRTRPSEVGVVIATAEKQRESLRSAKKDLRGFKRTYKLQSRALKHVDEKVLSAIIAYRNQFCKKRAREDFATRLQDFEYSSESTNNTGAEDSFKYNPGFLKSLKINLPVFCVSSRGYQTLCKRMVKDRVKGFYKKEQTDRAGFILARHYSQCLASMGEWAAPPIEIPECKKDKIWYYRRAIDAFLRGFDAEMGGIFRASTKDMRSLVEKDSVGHSGKHVFRLLHSQANVGEDIAIAAATGGSEKVAEMFGKKPTVLGGVSIAKDSNPMDADSWHWGTLHALCIKKGNHRTRTKVWININKILCAPMVDKIAGRWAESFEKGLPDVLKKLQADIYKALEKAQKEIQQILLPIGFEDVKLKQMVQWVRIAQEARSLCTQTVLADMQLCQRSLSGVFQEAVQSSMDELYTEGA